MNRSVSAMGTITLEKGSHMKQLLLVIGLVFLITVANGYAGEPAPTQEEIDIVSNGNEGVALWQCAVAASVAERAELAEKYFMSGYNKIIQFFDYVRAGHATKYSKSNSAIILSLNAHGPSSDFCAGAVYSQIADDFYKRELKGIVADTEAKKLAAENYLHLKNCSFID